MPNVRAAGPGARAAAFRSLSISASGQSQDAPDVRTPGPDLGLPRELAAFAAAMAPISESMAVLSDLRVGQQDKEDTIEAKGLVNEISADDLRTTEQRKWRNIVKANPELAGASPYVRIQAQRLVGDRIATEYRSALNARMEEFVNPDTDEAFVDAERRELLMKYTEGMSTYQAEGFLRRQDAIDREFQQQWEARRNAAQLKQTIDRTISSASAALASGDFKVAGELINDLHETTRRSGRDEFFVSATTAVGQLWGEFDSLPKGKQTAEAAADVLARTEELMSHVAAAEVGGAPMSDQYADDIIKVDQANQQKYYAALERIRSQYATELTEARAAADGIAWRLRNEPEYTREQALEEMRGIFQLGKPGDAEAILENADGLAERKAQEADALADRAAEDAWYEEAAMHDEWTSELAASALATFGLDGSRLARQNWEDGRTALSVMTPEQRDILRSQNIRTIRMNAVLDGGTAFSVDPDTAATVADLQSQAQALVDQARRAPAEKMAELTAEAEALIGQAETALRDGRVNTIRREWDGWMQRYPTSLGANQATLLKAVPYTQDTQIMRADMDEARRKYDGLMGEQVMQYANELIRQFPDMPTAEIERRVVSNSAQFRSKVEAAWGAEARELLDESMKRIATAEADSPELQTKVGGDVDETAMGGRDHIGVWWQDEFRLHPHYMGQLEAGGIMLDSRLTSKQKHRTAATIGLDQGVDPATLLSDRPYVWMHMYRDGEVSAIAVALPEGTKIQPATSKLYADPKQLLDLQSPQEMEPNLKWISQIRALAGTNLLHKSSAGVDWVIRSQVELALGSLRDTPEDKALGERIRTAYADFLQ